MDDSVIVESKFKFPMHTDIGITNLVAIFYIVFVIGKLNTTLSGNADIIGFLLLILFGVGGGMYLIWRLREFLKFFQKITITKNSIRFENILTKNQIELYFKELDGLKEEEIRGFFYSSEITHFVKNGWYIKEVNVNSLYYKNYDEIVTNLKLKYLGRKITEWKP
ncbi:MAG: hypothetical protein H6573_20560 [Lewinellaceae bacterium]|nr:hypothetical protein [Lewinellaceae bacterium]